MNDSKLIELWADWQKQADDFNAFNAPIIDLDQERQKRMASKEEIELLQFIAKGA